MTDIAPPPQPSIPTLVVVADQDEVTDLIPANADVVWQVPSSGANEQMAWKFDNLVVVVTGSGGPAIAAVTARFLAEAPLVRPFEQVVNFGSCGRYSWSEQTELCGAYFVSESREWDLSFNFRGWEYANAPMRIARPPHVDAAADPVSVDRVTADRVTCFSGGRYSTPADRHWPMWLEGDVEEYELYAIAWLCLELGVPLAGIKFVTNSPGADATADKAKYMAKARKAGTDLLRSYLAGELGYVDAAPVNLAAASPD
ncbi:MAG: hypothetical protein ACR2QW_05140 [bacterium]